MSAGEVALHRVARLELESGAVLRDVTQAFVLLGALNADRDNLVVVFHSLTGRAETVGGWLGTVIGPGLAVDTGRYPVLCANLLGSCYGTTGPAERRPFPEVTPRDQARLVQLLVDEIGVRSVALAPGGSLGGMVALEWAAQNPCLARSTVVFAPPAAHTAHAIAWNHVQRAAIEAAGERGVEIARMVAMMTYRTATEQAARFGRGREEDGGWSVASYLEHQGRKLRDRFGADAYVTLTRAMDAHDVGRGRGGTAAALRRIEGDLVGVGIPGDLLYAPEDVRAWTDAAGAEYRELRSGHGHDAFLLEHDQVAAILADALAATEPAAGGARLSAVETAPIAPRTARGPRVVRVALAGCGVVGGELVRLLAHGAGEIRSRHGVRLELASVLVKHPGRPRPSELPGGVLTTEVDAFLASGADVWVEAIGGTNPALRIARTVLGAGRRLVTANKALLAAHGPELAALARRSRARLDFESAVAGGVPVIRALRDSLGLTGIRAIRGVLNGTTNYILTRLGDGWRYANALADAQARGFAEANPARDLSGEHAADELRILAWLAFGVEPGALIVRRRGIEPWPERLAADAALVGGVPRLVAEVVDTAAGIVAAVEPVIVAAGGELGRTRDEENAVVVESRWNGRVRLSGPGAGGAPTASALLGDVLRSASRAGRTHAAPHTPVDDAREHRWVISVRREGAARTLLERTLDRAGVPAADVLAEGDRMVAVTHPVAWRRVDLAVRSLQTAHLAPVVSRCEVRV